MRKEYTTETAYPTQQPIDRILEQTDLEKQVASNDIPSTLFLMDYAQNFSTYLDDMNGDLARGGMEKTFLYVKQEAIAGFQTKMNSCAGRKEIYNLLNSVQKNKELPDYYKNVAKNIMQDVRNRTIEELLDGNMKDFTILDTTRHSDINPKYVLSESFLVLNHYHSVNKNEDFEGTVLVSNRDGMIYTTGWSNEDYKNFFQSFDFVVSNHDIDDGQYNLLKSRMVDFFARNGYVEFSLEPQNILPTLGWDKESVIAKMDIDWVYTQGMRKFFSSHVPLNLSYIGRDGWDRPAFEVKETGQILVDISLGREYFPNLHTVVGNVVGGEPDNRFPTKDYILHMDYGIKENMYLRCNKTDVDDDGHINFLKGNYYKVFDVFEGNYNFDTIPSPNALSGKSYSLEGEFSNLTVFGVHSLSRHFDMYERTTEEIAMQVNRNTQSVDLMNIYHSLTLGDTEICDLPVEDRLLVNGAESLKFYAQEEAGQAYIAQVTDIKNLVIRDRTNEKEPLYVDSYVINDGIISPVTLSTTRLASPVLLTQEQEETLQLQRSVACIMHGCELPYPFKQDDIRLVDTHPLTGDELTDLKQQLIALNVDIKEGFVSLPQTQSLSSVRGALKEALRLLNESNGKEDIDGKKSADRKDKPVSKDKGALSKSTKSKER